MKILVADDVPENRILLDKLLTRMRHQVILAENGQQAVELFGSTDPDLILMDIMMPEMDGLQAIKQIRLLATEKWVPIFVISALAEVQDVVDGLQAGADDYLPKPFNQAILNAKLSSVQRSLDMQRCIIADSQQLQIYRDQNETEQLFLQSIFERLIKQNDVKDEHLQFWLQPAQRFSGDLICAQRINSRQIYFMLADATGHGLAAAIPTVIVNQAFQAMTQKGLSIPLIVREINRLLFNQMPPDRFVALVLGMIDSARKSIELWNGGLPEVLALNGDGEPLHAFHSSHTFAGVLDDTTFDDRCETWHWQHECEIFMYSDGLPDAQNPDHELFGQDNLLRTLAQAKPGHRVAAIQQALRAHMADRDAQDDISCMAILCP
ncbi:SpoIIE family protein phosphatase [Methylomonas montana]|uniref:PP2C family protein-serine/threonine phosphatase n=1 Tax=Methylomonas montana TaxID=3058963 RepID=UPI00265AC400|nr:SpoIIE family protein phosphatase [Methylomonas montana]WKJ90007.1 SpoIIE family protein phosphatase [Methylomonas montana]